MYLHLGNQVIALQKSVLGVFDMDTATWSHRTRETLEKWEQVTIRIQSAIKHPNRLAVRAKSHSPCTIAVKRKIRISQSLIIIHPHRLFHPKNRVCLTKGYHFLYKLL